MQEELQIWFQSDLSNDVSASERGGVIFHWYTEASESYLVLRQIILKPLKKYKKIIRTLSQIFRDNKTYKEEKKVVQPFIKFWVEVSLLHSCFFLSGLAFIWQQHEGDIAVHTILMLRQQTSVWIKNKQYKNEI